MNKICTMTYYWHTTNARSASRTSREARYVLGGALRKCKGFETRGIGALKPFISKMVTLKNYTNAQSLSVLSTFRCKTTSECGSTRSARPCRHCGVEIIGKHGNILKFHKRTLPQLEVQCVYTDFQDSTQYKMSCWTAPRPVFEPRISNWACSTDMFIKYKNASEIVCWTFGP